MRERQWLFIGLAVAAGAAAYHVPLPLSQAARYTMTIFGVAAVLWITEAVPLFVTSLVVAFLQVVLLGLPGGALGMASGEYREFLSPFFDPVVVLFLGGFALGAALHRHRLDRVLARAIVRWSGTTPRKLLLGLMLGTAFLSMWISNTATAALMMTVALPLLASMGEGHPFRKAVVLGIPFAANIGGLGTPIGTPPNAIALGALARMGMRISFVRWMILALPVVAGLLLLAWWLLGRVYGTPGEMPGMSQFLAEAAPLEPSREVIMVMGTFVVTVLMWLTVEIHGIPEGVVALIPIIFLFGSGLLRPRDLGGLGWETLILVGGGLSLGVGMRLSGLAESVVAGIRLTDLALPALLLVTAAVAAAMTSLISNSATASLLIPLTVALGTGQVVPAVVALALASSVSMALPISTPPNAIAFASGEIRSADMVKSGLVLTIAGVILVAAAGLVYWPLIGVM